MHCLVYTIVNPTMSSNSCTLFIILFLYSFLYLVKNIGKISCFPFPLQLKTLCSITEILYRKVKKLKNFLVINISV